MADKERQEVGWREELVIDEGDVSVLLNRGDGTFQEPVIYPVEGAPHPYSLIAADLNGDGKPDLVTEASVLLNNGNGTFRNAFTYEDGGSLVSIVAADLDGDTEVDILVNGAVVLLNQSTPPFSLDRNQNGIPDECDFGAFHRGDPNSSGTTDISDGIAIFGFLFLGEPPTLSCKESADANNDGTIDISDGIAVLNWLFTGGPEPAAPGPAGIPCGFDLDPPGSPGDLGCEFYSCK